MHVFNAAISLLLIYAFYMIYLKELKEQFHNIILVLFNELRLIWDFESNK